MLARVVNMRGVDISRFEFDYDLTWVAFFLAKHGNILGRFGGRDAGSADKYLTVGGLKYAMSAALEAHKRGDDGQPPAPPADRFRHAEDYPSAKRLKSNACIHCHQVYNFRQDWLRSQGNWTRERIWEYPQPENLGLSVYLDQQNRVKAVKSDSPAERAGLRLGDELMLIDQHRLASFADVQFALHRAPTTGHITVRWQRGEQKHEADVELPEKWRESDISWRTSMWNLEPAASVHGQDLTPRQKKEIGLGPEHLAFRQGSFVLPAARDAGIRQGDLIIGIDGKHFDMTMLQFNAYVRLNFNAGDTITFNVLRDGKRLDLPMKLPKK